MKPSDYIPAWTTPRAAAEAGISLAAGVFLLLLFLLRGDRSAGLLLFLGALAAAAALLYYPVQKRQEQRRKRERLLRNDYSDLVTQLTLFLAAGLSLRSCWNRILLDAREDQAQGLPFRLIFAEMERTSREILGGVPEDQAYGRFGRRLGLPEYLRLGSLLESYVQQGNRELLGRLEQEAASVQTLGMGLVRRRSEEVRMLLLLPVMILFALTLLLVTVPAFLQLGSL